MPTVAGTQPLAAQRQFYVTVSGVPGYFATKTGGETTADVTDVYDGGAQHPEKLAHPAVHANIVIGRPYRTARDQPIVASLRKKVGSFRPTVTVQPTDADGTPYGRPTVYASALLTRITDPDVDAASGDPARMELEFAIESVA